MAVAPPRFRVYGLPGSVLELYRRAVCTLASIGRRGNGSDVDPCSGCGHYHACRPDHEG